MNESSTSSTPPGREPPSGHPDVPSQSGDDETQGRDTADDAVDAGQGESDVAPPPAAGEHGEIEQAPGPIEGERTGASDIADQDEDEDDDDDEAAPADEPSEPVDVEEDATSDPNDTGKPEPGEMDPTQLG